MIRYGFLEHKVSGVNLFLEIRSVLSTPFWYHAEGVLSGAPRQDTSTQLSMQATYVHTMKLLLVSCTSWPCGFAGTVESLCCCVLGPCLLRLFGWGFCC
jgi:hypothetical protein